jgi:hypothetical protein
LFINKNIEYIINLTSELNTQHNSIYIPGHIIVVDYNIFIGLFWMNCRRFQGTAEGIRFMVFNVNSLVRLMIYSIFLFIKNIVFMEKYILLKRKVTTDTNTHIIA